MKKTSLEAFKEIESKLPEKRKRVFKAIEASGSKGTAAFELVTTLGRPINEISGRITELFKDGLIQESGRRMNPGSGKFASVWTVTPRSNVFQTEFYCDVVN